jgi:hypothetical protein
MREEGRGKREEGWGKRKGHTHLFIARSEATWQSPQAESP